MEHEREREGRITDEQKILLLEFMEDHPDFARGKFCGNDGRKKLSSLWEVLATRLNSVKGPKKSTAKWKRVWIDLRNKTKRKASEVRALRMKTGGGSPSDISLSVIDERIVTVMSEEAVYGLTATDGTVLDSDETFPSFATPTVSTSLATPVASTSFANPMETIVSMPSPQSASDHLEVFESDESLVMTESDVEGIDEVISQPKKKKKKITSMDAFQVCVENSECLNKKMDRLIDVMQELVEEKKKQTSIMEKLLLLLKK